jgi:hypothetical protein
VACRSFGCNPSGLGWRLFPSVACPRSSSRPLRSRAHANRQRRWGSHKSLEASLEQVLRLVEIDRPSDPEDTIAEQEVGVRVPVGGADALPRWRSKVVRHDSQNPAVPGALRIGFCKLGGNCPNHESESGQPYQPTYASQSPHTSIEA